MFNRDFYSCREFSDGISELVSHVEAERAKEKFFETQFKASSGTTRFERDFDEFFERVIKKSSLSSKKYLYSNSIVSLYGLLERFIESSIIEYVKGLSESSSCFTKLPSPIQKNHLELSLELIKKKNRDRVTESIDVNQQISAVLSNLGSCADKSRDFVVNSEAFSIHASNFRFNSINELFSKAGLERLVESAVKDSEDFLEVIKERNNFEGCVESSVLRGWIESELEDLAQRRNEVSHGFERDDIESADLFLQRAKVIKSLCFAISDFLLIDLNFKSFCLRKSEMGFLGRPGICFPKIGVLGFLQGSLIDCGRKTFSIGENIFAFNPDSKYPLVSGKIVGIKVNDIDVSVLILPVEFEVSLKVDFTVNDKTVNRLIYL